MKLTKSYLRLCAIMLLGLFCWTGCAEPGHDFQTTLTGRDTKGWAWPVWSNSDEVQKALHDRIGHANEFILYTLDSSHVFLLNGIFRRGDELYVMLRKGDRIKIYGPVQDSVLRKRFDRLVEQRNDLTALDSFELRYQTGIGSHHSDTFEVYDGSSLHLFEVNLSHVNEIRELDNGFALEALAFKDNTIEEDDDADIEMKKIRDIRWLRQAKRTSDWYFGFQRLLDDIVLAYAESTRTGVGFYPYRADPRLIRERYIKRVGAKSLGAKAVAEIRAE